MQVDVDSDAILMNWELLELAGDVPSPRADHTATVVDDHTIAVIGGRDHYQYFNDVYMLDLQQVPPVATRRYPGSKAASELIVWCDRACGRRSRAVHLALLHSAITCAN